jgi:hypothetical protein
MKQARDIHYSGLIDNNRHPELDPGSILISIPPAQKWFPYRASLDRKDVVLA